MTRIAIPAYDGAVNAEVSVTESLSDHPHHHDHAHDHAGSEVPSDPALRTKALESLLIDKGLVDPAAIDAWVDAYESRIGPRRGAQIVARAWVDPQFKARLLQDATRAIEPFGFLGREGQHIVVLENTPTVHNLVVCTLCSCYPWGLLGLPPRWYKAAPYRARSVIDPRGVLAEFGVVLGDEVEVRVWDSTAEIRYLVLPERPAGTDGLSEAELAELVTRDAMIGVVKVEGPKGRKP
ncbi:MAG TPA: nitrile hydratase subunit alpha [Dongiaceae bacterium]|nr:nitrile hydratase subunit alpha [Dongiaceae bacterium]